MSQVLLDIVHTAIYGRQVIFFNVNVFCILLDMRSDDRSRHVDMFTVSTMNLF